MDGKKLTITASAALLCLLFLVISSPSGDAYHDGTVSADGMLYTVIEEPADGVPGRLCFVGTETESSELTVPATVGEYEVTSFSVNRGNFSYARSLSLPSTVTAIRISTLGNLSSLEALSVDPGNGVYGCSGSAGLYEKAGMSLLFVVNGIEGTYAVEEGIRSVPDGVLSDHGLMTGLLLPSTLESFGCCTGCPGLSEIHVDPSNTVFTVERGMLIQDGDTVVRCVQTASGDMVLPEGIRTVEAYAFSDCTGITGMFMDDGLVTVGGSAFRGCTTMSEARIPDGLRMLGECAFMGCASLTHVDLPDGLTVLAGHTFADTGLTSFRIPAGIASIGAGCFDGCASLTEFDVDPENGRFTAVGGLLCIAPGSLYCCPQGISGHLDMPDGIIGMNSHAVMGCDLITSLELPSGLRDMHREAIFLCSGLSSVVIPYGLQSLESGTVARCDSLVSMSIPASVGCIEPGFFGSVPSLKKLTVDCGCSADVFSAEGVEEWVLCNPADSASDMTLMSEDIVLHLPESVLHSVGAQRLGITAEHMSVDDFPFQLRRHLSFINDIYGISFDGTEGMSDVITADLTFTERSGTGANEVVRVSGNTLEKYPAELLSTDGSLQFRVEVPLDGVILCYAVESGGGFDHYPAVGMTIIVIGTLGGAFYLSRHRRP